MIVELETIKKHLNLESDFTDDDEYIEMLEEAAELLVAKKLDTEAKTISYTDPETGEVTEVNTTNLDIYYSSDIPALVKYAVLEITAYYYDQREPVVMNSFSKLPMRIDDICNLLGNYSI